MQEWLNWPAWKASKPQKGFGGSNPPLSAKSSDFFTALFVFVYKTCKFAGYFYLMFHLCK